MSICLKSERFHSRVTSVLQSTSKQSVVMRSILKFKEAQMLKLNHLLQLIKTLLDEKTFMKMKKIILKIRSKTNEDN